MSALADLAAAPVRLGQKWEPPAEIVADLLAARAAKHGYKKISDALQRDGHDVGAQAVRGWFERLESAANDRTD